MCGGGGGGGLGCVSHDCKLNLVTVQGNLKGPRYQNDILETVVIPLRDHKTSVCGRQCKTPSNACSDAITPISWPARNPDLNPVENLWVILGRPLRQRHHPIQNLAKLSAALHQEWRAITQRQIQGRKDMFYLTTHSTHFIYGYMASDIL